MGQNYNVSRISGLMLDVASQKRIVSLRREERV